jgi:L-amino acid N-acyltransferase YncA
MGPGTRPGRLIGSAPGSGKAEQRMNATDIAPVLIRAATVDDVDAVTSIYGHHVKTGTASFEIDPPDCDEMTRRFHSIAEHRLPYVVAQRSADEPVVIGYAYASMYRPRPAYRYTLEDSVYVASGYAGRGVGRALLQRVIVACENSGFRQMLAVIGGADNQASIRLHAALGFVHVGRLPAVGRKFEHWLDTVLMQRSLGSGSNSAPG